MNIPQSLTGKRLSTYKTIFQHPVSHNLEWHAVLSLLGHLGRVVDEPNGHVKVTRNGQVLVLHHPHTKDAVDADAVMTLRHFLEQSLAVPVENGEKHAHWLVLIDHHKALIFGSDIPGASPHRILPYDPTGHFGHERDSKDVSRAKEKPEPNSFFQAVAEELKTAGQILIFGTGTGTSSAMGQFIAWLQIHHPVVAERIVGSLVVDEHHLTNDQLLAKAREFYGSTAG